MLGRINGTYSGGGKGMGLKLTRQKVPTKTQKKVKEASRKEIKSLEVIVVGAC